MSNNLSKNWINIFDAIFYINMEKSIERRKHIESEFAHFDGELIRINATTPEILGNEFINTIVDKNQKFDEPYRVKDTTKANKNEISLGFSHSEAITSAIELFKTTGKSRILIIEDDASIVELSTFDQNQLMFFEDVKYDVWQLGYTIFNENYGSWLMEREYSIKCSKLRYDFATAESGIFGTLGYVINLCDENVSKFEKFASELSKGSISDYCLSEQKYLKKIIWKKKLLMPINDESTISTSTEYSAVEDGYKLNAFNEGFVKGSQNYDQTLITCNRDSYDNRLAYLVVEFINKEIHTSVYIKTYFDESIDDVVNDAKDLFEQEHYSGTPEVRRAYVVAFHNLSKPNLGKRYFIQQSHHESTVDIKE